MWGATAWKAGLAAAAGLLLTDSALADEPIALTARKLDSVTAGGIITFSESGALAIASGDAALALTLTDASVDNGAAHADLEGQAVALAVGQLDAASIAFTDLIAANGADIQAVMLGAESLGGGSVVTQAETAASLSMTHERVAAEGTALSSGDESFTSSGMLLTTSAAGNDLEVAAAADGLSTGGGISLAQTLGQLDAEALAADIAARTSADDAALGSAAALLSLNDGESNLSIIGLAEAAATGEPAVATVVTGRLYESRSVDRGHISGTAIAIGSVSQESAAITGATGTGNIVITISNTMSRLIDATDSTPPIARTHSSTTIVTVNAP